MDENAIFGSIVQNIIDHLVNNLGFYESDCRVEKCIEPSEELMSDEVLNAILSGKAYKGADPVRVIMQFMPETYFGEKVMGSLDQIVWTKEEADYLSTDDEDYAGWDSVEEWMRDYVSIFMSPIAVREYVFQKTGIQLGH